MGPWLRDGERCMCTRKDVRACMAWGKSAALLTWAASEVGWGKQRLCQQVTNVYKGALQSVQRVLIGSLQSVQLGL